MDAKITLIYRDQSADDLREAVASILISAHGATDFEIEKLNEPKAGRTINKTMKPALPKEVVITKDTTSEESIHVLKQMQPEELPALIQVPEPEPAAEPAPKPEPEPVTTALTLDDVRKRFTEISREYKGARQKVSEILACAGARNMSQLPPDKFESSLAEIEAWAASAEKIDADADELSVVQS